VKDFFRDEIHAGRMQIADGENRLQFDQAEKTDDCQANQF